MLLDRYLINSIGILGNNILEKSGLSCTPQNIDEMYSFLNTLKTEAEKGDDSAAMICQILFSFVTSVEVRDRHTSPREFEDIFSSLFNTESTDTTTRNNPIAPAYIKEYDRYSKDEDWDVSTDLSTNKREKADVVIGSYMVSLKTLKGAAIDINGNVTDKSFNDEINVGGFSFRALFKGIISDQELVALKDRKGGLGSGGQMRKNALNPILEAGKIDEFYTRLCDYMKYVYSDDLFLVIKSDYHIKFYLIPSETFINAVCTTYRKNEPEFQKLFYRWENNNLRIKLKPLLESIYRWHFKIREIDIDLSCFVHNAKVSEFNNFLNECISSELEGFDI